MTRENSLLPPGQRSRTSIAPSGRGTTPQAPRISNQPTQTAPRAAPARAGIQYSGDEDCRFLIKKKNL